MAKKTVAQLVADDLTALAIRRSKGRIAALEAENGRLLSRLETLSRNWHEQRHMGSWESCLLSCQEDRAALAKTGA